MHGLYLLWWVQEQGMPAALVASILAAGDLALTALEVPTGWLADRFGHRASLIAGSICQVAGMLCCWFGRSVPAMIAASLLIALGDAFRSGADHALLYRTCVAMGDEHAFQRIEARTRALQTAALVVMVLAGGAIVSRWGFPAGWAAETILSVVGLAIAYAMVEPPASAHTVHDDPSADDRRVLTIALASLIVPAALLGAVASAASFLTQTIGPSEPQRMTIAVAAITLAEALGSALAVRLPVTGARGQILLATTGTLLLAASSMIPNGLLIAAIVLAALDGLAHPLRAAAIQRVTLDSARARAASTASAVDMALATLLVPLAVWLWS